MTTAPKVSIIVPVYNAEQYLSGCLDSLSGQTLKEIEIICVNDGATDKSADILNEYKQKDSRLRIISQKNAGTWAARNTGLENAKGKYILFCDDDDTFELDAAQDLFEIAEREAVDIVIFNFNIIEAGRIDNGKKDKSGKYINKFDGKKSGKLTKKECWNISFLPTMWGYFFRRDIINHYKIRFPSRAITDDVTFLLSYLLTIHTGYALNKMYYNYFLRKSSGFEEFNNHRLRSLLFNFFALLRDTFVFALKNRMLQRELYFFYWTFVVIKKRILKI